MNRFIDPDARNTGENWRRQAACRDRDPEIFFPTYYGALALEAKAVCANCPVRSACLDWALKTNQTDGVWGGKGPTELGRLRAKTARAVSSAVLA